MSDELAGLRRLARCLVRGPDSEDLVQRTVVVALEQEATPRQPGAWLRQVMRNQARDLSRRNEARRRREHRADPPPPSLPSPDEAAFHAELQRGMHEALRSLPSIYREVLELRFLHDRSPSSIAEQLACSPSTARWRIHEGLRRLRLAMDRRFEGRQQWHRALWVAYVSPDLSPAGSGEAVDPIDLESGLHDAHAEPCRMEPRNSSPSSSCSPSPATERSVSAAAPRLSMPVTATLAVAGCALAVAGLVGVTEDSDSVTTAADRSSYSTAHSDTNRTAHPIRSTPQHDLAPPTSPRNETRPSILADAAVRDGDLEAIEPAEPRRRPWPELCEAERRAAGLMEARLRYDIRVPSGKSVADRPEELDIRATSGCVDCRQAFNPDNCKWEPGQCQGDERPVERPELIDCVREHAFARGAPGAAPRGPDMPAHIATVRIAPIEGDCPPGPKCWTGFLPEPTPEVARWSTRRAIEHFAFPGTEVTEASQTLVICTAYSPASHRSQRIVERVARLRPDIELRWANSPAYGFVRGNRAMVAAQAQGKAREMREFLRDAPKRGNLHDDLLVFARHSGMDVGQFERDLYSEATSRTIADQRAWCRARGVYGDPGLVIGDRLYEGRMELDELLEALDP